MPWFRRKKKKQSSPGAQGRATDEADAKHLAEFIQSRHGVEAYLEPETYVTETTVMLIAYDGEWTRRHIGGMKGAFNLTKKHDIPLYEVEKTGYPQRKRDFDERRRIERKRAQRRRLNSMELRLLGEPVFHDRYQGSDGKTGAALHEVAECGVRIRRAGDVEVRPR